LFQEETTQATVKNAVSQHKDKERPSQSRR
jgi:hypothetical protein